MTAKPIFILLFVIFSITICAGDTIVGLYGQQLKTEINDTVVVVNLSGSQTSIGCVPQPPEVRVLVVTRIIFLKVRSVYDESICRGNPIAAQVEQTARDAMGLIRRECTGKMGCDFSLDTLLSSTIYYNSVPNVKTCLSAINWNVSYTCINKARIFGNECQRSNNYSITQPYKLSTARMYGFVMSPGYPLFSPPVKECYWLVEQPGNRYTYIVIYDVDLDATSYALRLRSNMSDVWEVFFQDDSFAWVNSTLTTWQKQVEVNVTSVRIGLSKTNETAVTGTARRGFLMYYEVQYHCTYPASLKSSFTSKNVIWPPIVTGNTIVVRCDLDHVFAGTSLKLKSARCVGTTWSPTLDELIGANGCKTVEGSGEVQEDLSPNTILGIIFGSLAAFGLLIAAVTLLTLKRKYHTYFPCCRKRRQKGRLPAAVQPKYTPSSASNGSYGVGFSRSESDRSNVTTYTMLTNPYGPVTKPLSTNPDVLASSTQYAPVLKQNNSAPSSAVNSSLTHTGSTASAPPSQYAPTSGVSTDSYGECSVYGGSLRSDYTPMQANAKTKAIPEHPHDDDENEQLYEDPIAQPKRTESSDEEYEHPIKSPAPVAPVKATKTAKPAAKRREVDGSGAFDDAGDRIPLAPAPPPPASAAKGAKPRNRASDMAPLDDAPPPPAPKTKPAVTNTSTPIAPERPPKLNKSQKNEKAGRDSGEYIDFKDSQTATPTATVSAHRESQM